jgi:MazG family protein
MIDKKFDDFVEIVKRLRKECPWDRVQTNDSIKDSTIEEVYEVVEAIENKDYEELKKELGDLLLHVVFHSIIAEGENKFKLEDVIDFIQAKLIRRHPHVFGNAEAESAETVKKNWEVIKLSEGRKSILEGVPQMMPGLQRAYRLQEKAAKVGFDWDNKEDVWKKVLEEVGEMHEAEENFNNSSNNAQLHEHIEKEMGDVFFALVNYARFLKINPENALRKTNQKFINRFNYVEEKIAATGRKINESNLEEMDKYWNESKKDIN